MVALIEWFWKEIHILKIVGSNPSGFNGWTFFHLHLLYKLSRLFEKTKINKKRPGMVHF